MSLRFLKSLITCGILFLYVLTPMLDSMVCTDCIGKAPYQGETTIGHLQTPYGDVISPSHDGAQSETPGSDEQAAKCFCSICVNFLAGVKVFAPRVHIVVARWAGPGVSPALSELHYSIDRPPQNLLA